jgi:hypothetical protein
MHRGGEGERGIKVYPPSKFFAKPVNKNAIKQDYHPPKTFTTYIVAKTSWTLPLDFQTVCIYGGRREGKGRGE